ncbi:Bax inhibitor-1 family protein, putative [Theobroma cacao]|uniref:Bax inhibitor-1 family protein, putative n=1 Tax=Theobroma cacao TaxID=3641 RepID=A0A061F5M1_THECC|nr:Bax inhibitor-1 family protein, putative [Theobroma cacao]
MARDGNSINSPLLPGSCRGNEWDTIFVAYALISLQLLLAVAFGSNLVFNSGIPCFELIHTTPGLTICIISFILWLVVQCPLLAFSNHSPWNFLLFALWSILFAFTIGLSCSYLEENGRTILVAIILMSVVTVSLTVYALCGAIGDFDFSLCAPCFLGTFLVLCLYVTIQIFGPAANLSTSVYAVLAALLFVGHTYIAGNQMVKDGRDDIEDPISAIVYSYWTFFYHPKLACG